ncbi:MAG: YqeG family HAD IIIA-type phosphatase [Cyanobacteriota bacterium]|nr:YqeG family HAD IIIA-type phosphatase [Cyanobacteriota bacterium]
MAYFNWIQKSANGFVEPRGDGRNRFATVYENRYIKNVFSSSISESFLARDPSGSRQFPNTPMASKPFFQWLQPDIKVEGTILSLTAAMLSQRGIRGIIFDVDDTLVPLLKHEASQEVKTWIAGLPSSWQLWLVSNNMSRRRIAQIAEGFGLPHIHRAGKPSRRALRKALHNMQLPVEQVAIVGDRRLTDILAGNRLGLLTVLVDPLTCRSKDPTHSVWQS